MEKKNKDISGFKIKIEEFSIFTNGNSSFNNTLN
jgi:hypothetical protein